jgi:hypothetical protein
VSLNRWSSLSCDGMEYVLSSMIEAIGSRDLLFAATGGRQWITKAPKNPRQPLPVELNDRNRPLQIANCREGVGSGLHLLRTLKHQEHQEEPGVNPSQFPDCSWTNRILVSRSGWIAKRQL